MSNIFDAMLAGDPDSNAAPPSPATNEDPGLTDPSAANQADSSAASSSASTPRDVKDVVQELLRYGYIDQSTKGPLFQKSMIHSDAVGGVLEPLDLSFHLDELRGIGLLKVKQDDHSEPDQAWSHPLVRRQRLTLEQSLMVAILRQAFIAHEQEAGIGEATARIGVDDLLPQFLTYFEDSHSDAKNESRLLNILDQLKTHGIISEVDKKHEITIRPLIAHLADPAALQSLLAILKRHAANEPETKTTESDTNPPSQPDQGARDVR